MFRSVLSVFLGLVLMMILVMTSWQLLSIASPGIFPTAEQIESGAIPTIPVGLNLIMLISDILIAAFAGYFTVAIAGESRLGHAKALAVVIFVMSLMNLPQSWGIEASWYVIARFCSVPVALYLGGVLRCKQYPPKTIKTAS